MGREGGYPDENALKEVSAMWKDLPLKQREEYKKMILAFASLSEMFAQKADDEADINNISPIINSKYQETVFQKVFHATAEDIGNTSYDAAIEFTNNKGKIIKYLIGIKTFGKYSGAQKIAQFKANHDAWSNLINSIKANSINKTRAEINEANKKLYEELAHKIAAIRNLRIDSSIANIRGFKISAENDCIEPVYHVLMPSKAGEQPKIYVGETTYDKINVDKIEIIGCTGERNPTNFEFSDGNHTYKYTSADSQLYMKFNNHDIVEEEWNVKYATDAYALFADLAEKVYTENKPRYESYSWLIVDENDQVQQFSGFNSFYGVGSKLSTDGRHDAVRRVQEKYNSEIPDGALYHLTMDILHFLTTAANNTEERLKKVAVRERIMGEVKAFTNKNFENDVRKLLYRPQNELYIPIPNSYKFHSEHPNFFVNNIMKLNTSSDNKLKFSAKKEHIELRKFTLVFEPSGEEIEAYITQDNGKAIESLEKQSYLGEWLLRKVFQLKEYEPLTGARLDELGINGLRLSKNLTTGKVHLQFIWIDRENPPEDFWGTL